MTEDLLERPIPADDAIEPEHFGQRFTVGWFPGPRGFGMPLKSGWIVRDWARRITIPFATKEEAQRHCERIAEIYAHYGW